MNILTQNIRNDDRGDNPPYSRIFVVCSKQIREEDLKEPFRRYGEIENLYIPKDRNSGESRGVAYIKYKKTSSAAYAIQAMNMKVIGNETKPLKVMISSNKHENNNIYEDKYRRLFLKVGKDLTESDLRKEFSEYGRIESVHIQRDKITEESKGFAYILYKSFLDAAKAYEECDRKYKAVFATPKGELKRSRNFEPSMEHLITSNPSTPKNSIYNDLINIPSRDLCHSKESVGSLLTTKPQGYKIISVVCSPLVPQKYIEKLFNVVPGMTQCQYITDTYNGVCKSTITYKEEEAAAYAVERLHNFEFPSGEILSVKPEVNLISKAANDLTAIVTCFKNSLNQGNPDFLQLADAIAQASTLINEATTGKSEQMEDKYNKNYCSVELPPVQPLADNNTRVAQRCFIVCKPQPPPNHVLRDIFCRFGDLIEVSTFPNKSFGFAKYASMKAANEAIKTLNGVSVNGIRIKVMEDENDKHTEDEKNHDTNDRKRIKLDYEM